MLAIRELKIILKIAKIIEEQISEFIANPHSHTALLKKLQDLHIPEFRKQRVKILGWFNFLPDEHDASMLIISLGKINTKFNSIENLIIHPPHKVDFFKNHNNLTERLQTNLKFIREELNKIEFDNEPNQVSDSTSPAPGA